MNIEFCAAVSVSFAQCCRRRSRLYPICFPVLNSLRGNCGLEHKCASALGTCEIVLETVLEKGRDKSTQGIVAVSKLALRCQNL